MQKHICFTSTSSLPGHDDYVLLDSFFNLSEQYRVLLNNRYEVTAFNSYAADFTVKHCCKQLQKGECIWNYVIDSFSVDFKAMCLNAAQGHTMQYEHYIKGTNKAGLWLNFTISRLYSFNNNISGFAIIGNDITLQKSFEKTIHHQTQSLSLIAQLQSHLVRQPVSSILGLINLVKEDDYDCRKEYFLGLEKATKQLDEIIQTIVKESRKV